METGLRLRTRRGGALIEMALVLPLLVLLTFGVAEYGWMFLKSNEVADAARRGARVASLPSATYDSVVTAVKTQISNSGIDPTACDVTVTPQNVSGAAAGSPISVRVSVHYAAIGLTGLPLLPVPDNLVSSVTMAKEGP
jgi:Flp pilus assembly protein TadG